MEGNGNGVLTTEITRLFEVSLIEVLRPKNLFIQILDTFLWFSNRHLRLNFFQNKKKFYFKVGFKGWPRASPLRNTSKIMHEQFFKDRFFITLSPKISCLFTRGSRLKLENFFLRNLITKRCMPKRKALI
jgi:hypothetical protein